MFLSVCGFFCRHEFAVVSPAFLSGQASCTPGTCGVCCGSILEQIGFSCNVKLHKYRKQYCAFYLFFIFCIRGICCKLTGGACSVPPCSWTESREKNNLIAYSKNPSLPLKWGIVTYPDSSDASFIFESPQPHREFCRCTGFRLPPDSPHSRKMPDSSPV